MDEQFETRPLIDRETLHELQQRRDGPTLVRLVIHVGAIACVALLLGSGHLPLVLQLIAFVALAGLLATIFAPFHECTHRGAFRRRRHNLIGAWITGTLWLLPPAVYRVFHFQHHRHTQDAQKDPEIMAAPDKLSPWPVGLADWLRLVPLHLFRLKVETTVRCALLPPERWKGFASWGSEQDRADCKHDAQIVLGIWVAIIVAALLGSSTALWFVPAAVASHFFLGLWLTVEHSGLPMEGNILALTRTTQSNAFVRFWTWNANYHAEHHAWPGIPWHQLPRAHELIKEHLEHHVTGYLAVHANVLKNRNRPTCDAQVEARLEPR